MIKKVSIFLSAIALFTCCLANADINSYQAFDHAYYEVCFTPGQDCTQDIVDAVNSAKSQILVQAYSFTSSPIAKALIYAHSRGVDVRAILDKSQKSERYSAAQMLINQHIPTWIDYKPAIAHNKVMIIDDEKVITGSFNFTKSAQYRNAENVLIIDCKPLAQAYKQNWDKRFLESKSANDYKRNK